MRASFGEIGTTLMTSGVSDAMLGDVEFETEIGKILGRYLEADFSDMEYPEDIEANLKAISGETEDRIVATYKTCKGKVLIITEWDRSATTLLFPQEY